MAWGQGLALKLLSLVSIFADLQFIPLFTCCLQAALSLHGPADDVASLPVPPAYSSIHLVRPGCQGPRVCTLLNQVASGHLPYIPELAKGKRLRLPQNQGISISKICIFLFNTGWVLKISYLAIFWLFSSKFIMKGSFLLNHESQLTNFLFKDSVVIRKTYFRHEALKIRDLLPSVSCRK